MAAFDKLPREVRGALNCANFPVAPQRLPTMLQRGASVGEVVQVLKNADAIETEKANSAGPGMGVWNSRGRYRQRS